MRTSPQHATEAPGEPAAADDTRRDRDQALHPLARQIRFRFIHAYRRHHLARTGRPSNFGSRLDPRWDGVEGRRGRQQRAIWYDVARLALSERVEPDELIEAAFNVADEGCLPQPTSLTSPSVVARARAGRGLAVENLLNALEVQQNIWKIEAFMITRHGGCDLNTAAGRVLKNGRLELSAIFRYCVATESGDVEVAGLFEEDAFEQYVLHKWAYDRAWGELIPAALKEGADRYLREG